MERPTAIARAPIGSNSVDIFPCLRGTTPRAQSCRFVANAFKIDDTSISRGGPPCNAEQFLGGGRAPTATFVVRSAGNFSARRVAARAANDVPSRTQIGNVIQINQAGLLGLAALLAGPSGPHNT